MPYDLYLLLEGSVYTKISNITAESKEDINLYDGSTYRDELNASFVGASPTLQGQTQSALGTSIFGGVAVPFPSGASIPNTYDGRILFDAAVGTNSSWNTANAAFFEQSDSYTHEPPRAWEKKRTRYVWTTTSGSFWAWADQIVAASTNPFGFVGSNLPT